MKRQMFFDCMICKKSYPLMIFPKDMQRWREGEKIQKALSYLKPGERELIISQTCEPCFDNMFKGDENEI